MYTQKKKDGRIHTKNNNWWLVLVFRFMGNVYPFLSSNLHFLNFLYLACATFIVRKIHKNNIYLKIVVVQTLKLVTN